MDAVELNSHIATQLRNILNHYSGGKEHMEIGQANKALLHFLLNQYKAYAIKIAPLTITAPNLAIRSRNIHYKYNLSTDTLDFQFYDYVTKR